MCHTQCLAPTDPSSAAAWWESKRRSLPQYDIAHHVHHFSDRPPKIVPQGAARGKLHHKPHLGPNGSRRVTATEN
jgi:hypothetical protein